jgi:putative transposase
MGSTYSSIYLQYIFAPKGRENKLQDSFREELHRYMTGIAHHLDHPCQILAIGSVEDHLHLVVKLHPMIAPAKFMQLVKANSSKWLNEKHFLKSKFEWQEGYGVFSYSHSQVEAVINYVLNQREHHRVKSFREEYLEMLRKRAVEFREEYVFEFYE